MPRRQGFSNLRFRHRASVREMNSIRRSRLAFERDGYKLFGTSRAKRERHVFMQTIITLTMNPSVDVGTAAGAVTASKSVTELCNPEDVKTLIERVVGKA